MSETKFIYMTFGLFTILLAFVATILHKDFLRKLIALNVLGVGVFCILITSAYNGKLPPDPLPHAMVLTGIVVAISATGLCLNMIKRYHRKEKPR